MGSDFTGFRVVQRPPPQPVIVVPGPLPRKHPLYRRGTRQGCKRKHQLGIDGLLARGVSLPHILLLHIVSQHGSRLVPLHQQQTLPVRAILATFFVDLLGKVQKFSDACLRLLFCFLQLPHFFLRSVAVNFIDITLAALYLFGSTPEAVYQVLPACQVGFQ